MGINPLDILIHIINIVVLYVLLRALLYKPVSRFLSQRTKNIQQQFEDAEQAKQEAEGLRASYEQRVNEANDEAQRILREGNLTATTSAAEILDSARRQASELLDEAREKATEERKEAMNDLEQQIADMAISLASQILQREVSEEDNHKVIETFFEQAAG